MLLCTCEALKLIHIIIGTNANYNNNNYALFRF